MQPLHGDTQDPTGSALAGIPPTLLMRVLLETAPNGMVIADADGHILHLNRHARTLLGWTDAGGRRNIHELFDTKDGAFRARAAAADAESPETRPMSGSLSLTALRADGSSFAAEVSLTPFDTGEKRYLMLAFSDITLRRAMELELERSNRDLEQFANVASHDLQEPLRVVVSYCELLQRRYGDKLDERAQGYIQHAVEATGRLRSMIDGLLDYSRVGQSTPARSAVDPRELANEVVHDLQTQAADGNVVVQVDEMPHEVWVDAAALRQVLQNLVSNSLKFRNRESAHVRVYGIVRALEHEFVVEDNGIGIEPSAQERVFQMFHRLHTRDEYPGSGLGLALCRRIVEAHDGRIWIESQPGAGTRVHFTIPRKHRT